MSTILIVDDIPENREPVAALLRARGHTVLQASNGAEGLAVVHGNHPDLVITDVLMPQMDGYEFIRRLRLDPATRGTAVVFHTGHYGERAAVTLALSGGVSDVLLKPATDAEILRVVDRILGGDAGQPGVLPERSAHFEDTHRRLLTDKLSAKVADLRAVNDRMRAVIDATLGLASERDSVRLLSHMCDAVRQLFGATSTALGILERGGLAVEHVVGCGLSPVCTTRQGAELTGLLEEVVRSRRSIRGNHDDADPASLWLEGPCPSAYAFMAAPISSPSSVYGWICVIDGARTAFTDDDEHLLLALAAQLGRIHGLEHEIAERAKAEAELVAARNLTRRYLDTADVMLVAIDTDGHITLVNQKTCDVVGWSEQELIGASWVETCVPERFRPIVCATLQDLRAGDGRIRENPVVTKTGTERLVEWHNTALRDQYGAISGFFTSGTDITERRALELHRLQTQKMEAVGQLAGGVAHDFNNLLTAILGYCELLIEDAAPDDPKRDDVLAIQGAGFRAAGLTRQLLAFSHKQVIAPAVVDLDVVVAGMRELLERLIPESIKVRLSPSGGAAFVKADRGELEQVVMNLCVNARDAMPDGGTILLETSAIDVEGVPHVVLTVTDTGTGMTPEVQERLFEPFFTTKTLGTGTGLGLATVHRITAQSGGSVVVRSAVGVGTAIDIRLPRQDPPMAVEQSAPLPPGRERRDETVLVVEDAKGVRELTRRFLDRQGYRVLVAANAGEAIRLFEENPSIDVLITDVVMPGRSGFDLARQLTTLRPSLRVVYMSGYSEAPEWPHGLRTSGTALLHKPFTSEALERKVREVMDVPGPSPAGWMST